MRRNSAKLLFFCALGSMLITGGTSTQEVTLLYPTLPQDSLAYDQGKIFLLSGVKDSLDSTITVSTQWQRTRFLDVSSDDAKGAFPKEFIKLFPHQSTIQKVWYAFKFHNYFSAPESVQCEYADTMNVRAFWRRPEFSNLLNEVKSTTAENLLLVIRGWCDTEYTTPYDDPNAENRALFKLQLHFISGLNTIYFAPGGRRKDALAYTTKLVGEPKPLEERDGRFHNSELEKSCVTCHEGLPSSDSGKTMKTDCSVCHKAIATASLVHAPVEMKECSSCHSWSPEKNSLIVTKGVPASCFDCHSEKQTTIDSAKVQHPVASDCLTCHSPHASNEAPHLVAKNIYDLCIGCHEDQKMNHPVGRHPVRFAHTKSDEEISCVSCHDPHGSNFDHLLTVGGSPMTICTKCH